MSGLTRKNLPDHSSDLQSSNKEIKQGVREKLTKLSYFKTIIQMKYL